MTRNTADLGGRRISWLQSGQGDPVVLLHAFPLHADMFAPQHAHLPHGLALVTPDLRGLGQSSGPAATSVDDHADDVLALMRHLGIEGAAIGGVSMGGYVAFAVHRKAPQRFRAIVLADTRADADNDEARAGRVRMQETAQRQGVAAIADAMVPKLLGKTSQASPAMVARVRDLILANGADGVIHALEALKTRPDSTSVLSDITCPALVVVGEEDSVTPRPLAESMHAKLAAATLKAVPAAGHLACLEQPEAFNAALWTFVHAV